MTPTPEPLHPGDRVHSDDSKQWPGVVLHVCHGFVSVQLDPSPEFPPGMDLTVGGREKDWLKF